MNKPLISRTLIWDGRQGWATYMLAHIPLLNPPRIGKERVQQIDYMPIVGMRMILEQNALQWRQMIDEECNDVDARLRQMLIVGMGVWD